MAVSSKESLSLDFTGSSFLLKDESNLQNFSSEINSVTRQPLSSIILKLLSTYTNSSRGCQNEIAFINGVKHHSRQNQKKVENKVTFSAIKIKIKMYKREIFRFKIEICCSDPVSLSHLLLFVSGHEADEGLPQGSDRALDQLPGAALHGQKAAAAPLEVFTIPKLTVRIPVVPDPIRVRGTNVIRTPRVITDDVRARVGDLGARCPAAGGDSRELTLSGQGREELIEAVIGCQSIGGEQGSTPGRAEMWSVQYTQGLGTDHNNDDSPARHGPRDSPAVTRHGFDDAMLIRTGRSTDTWDPGQPVGRLIALRHRGGGRPEYSQHSSRSYEGKMVAKSHQSGDVVSGIRRNEVCALLRAPLTLEASSRAM